MQLPINSLYLYAVAGGIMAVFYLVNLFTPYRRDCIAFDKAIKKATTPDFYGELPLVYHYSYKAFEKTCGQLPSTCIRFVARPLNYRLIVLPLLAVFVCLLNCFMAAYHSQSLFVNCCGTITTLFLFIVATLFIKRHHKIYEEKAREKFEQLLRLLDLSIGRSVGDKMDDNTADRIKFLTDNGVNLHSAEKISSLLSADNLSRPRTVEEQRKLNAALNGLLLVVSKSEKASSGR